MTAAAPVGGGGWSDANIWEHSAIVRDLYRARARDEAEEMDCAAQAVDILAPHLAPGDTVLDAGCGSGYLFHSFRSRGLDVEYWGIDATEALVAIGREELPAFGLPADRLRTIRIEDLGPADPALDPAVDHVVCMNVLSNVDNFHRPLERLLGLAGKTLVLRESAGRGAEHRWVRDRFLDPDVDLRVHVNRYDRDELLAFMDERGFAAEAIVDRRTGGEPELVIGEPHHWTFFLAVRRDG